MSSATRVLAVSDSAFSAGCLRVAVSSLQTVRVVDIAGPANAIEKAREYRPDLMLIHMPGSWSRVLDLTREASARLVGLKIILLGIPDGDCTDLQCIEAGARGWLPLSASFGHLQEVISIVSRGEVVCTPRLAYRLFERLSQLAGDSVALEEDASSCHLTARELEIVDLIAGGKGNHEIAAHLNLSVPAAKKRVHNILEKMRVRRSQLSAMTRPCRGSLVVSQITLQS